MLTLTSVRSAYWLATDATWTGAGSCTLTGWGAAESLCVEGSAWLTQQPTVNNAITDIDNTAMQIVVRFMPLPSLMFNQVRGRRLTHLR
jgi:hypothetical protein